MRVYWVAAASAVAVLGLPAAAHAAPSPAPEPATVTVSGSGAVSATPDELQLSLEASAKAASVAGALDAAGKAMTAVQAALTKDGVAAKDLQTSGLSVQPQYNQHDAITGYTASESLTAELRGLANAGPEISDATAAGGNAVRIDNMELDLTDQSPKLLGQARAKAITDAHTKATEFAEAAGEKATRVLSISQSDDVQPEPVVFAPMAAEKSAVPISAGTQQVTASVTVVYQLG